MSESRNLVLLPPLSVTIRTAEPADTYLGRAIVQAPKHLLRVLRTYAERHERTRIEAWAPNGALVASMSVSPDFLHWQEGGGQ